MKTHCLIPGIFLALAGAALAQTSATTAPNPQTAVVPPAWGPASPYPQDQAGAFQEPVAGGPGSAPLFQWGPVGLSPEATYELLYTDGILAGPGRPASTTLQSFSPGVLFQLGTNWTLEYVPTWEVYSNPLFHDTVDHSVRLDGKAVYEDWTVRLSQTYLRSSDPLVETGRQTPQQIYATALRSTYGYGARTLLELGLDQNIRLSSAAPDFYEWSTQDWLHFLISPRVDTAIGPGAGYVRVDPGVDMSYFRPEARLTWQAADKLSLDLQGGVESRKFINSASGNLTSSVYSATADYRLTDTTDLTAQADRDVEIAYAPNQITEVGRYTAGLRQRLLQHFYLGASAGWQKSDYIAIGGVRTDVRHDRAGTYQLSLSTFLLRHLNASLQYSHIRNDSDIPGFGIASNQYGLVLGYKY